MNDYDVIRSQLQIVIKSFHQLLPSFVVYICLIMGPPRKKRKLSNNSNVNTRSISPKRERSSSSSSNNSNRNHNHNKKQKGSTRNQNNNNSINYPSFDINASNHDDLFSSGWTDFLNKHMPNNFSILNGENASSNDFSFDINNLSPSTTSNAASPADNDEDDYEQQIQKLYQKKSTLESECEEWRRKYLNAEEERMKLSKLLKKEQLKSDQLETEKNFYQLRLKGISQMLKRGTAPTFAAAPLCKQNERISDRINTIKTTISNNHQQTKRNKKGYDVKINHYHSHQTWITQKNLAITIKNYVKKNKVDKTKPEILIAKTKPENTISCDMSDYDALPYYLVLEVFLCGKEHRIVALRESQRGLRAKINIPKHTVIGHYVGVEYTEKEWEDTFPGSNEESVRNVYAFNQTLRVPKENHNKNHNHTGDAIEYDEVRMVIDGHGLNQMIDRDKKSKKQSSQYSAHLLYINDCRQDINLEDPSDEDSKYWNVDFVSAEIDGYSMVFIVTRRDISKDEELLGWYGADYCKALKEHDRFQRMQNNIITLVDNSVLLGADLNDGNDREVWRID